MKLWRISNHADLTGTGGVRFSARWHTKGRPILYTAEHPAGALAEFLAHLDLEDIPVSFQMMTIEVETGVEPRMVEPPQLPEGWTGNQAITRAAGDTWLRGGQSLMLRVPSVLVPDAFNVLINPAHPDAGKLKLVKTQKVPLDHRLARR